MWAVETNHGFGLWLVIAGCVSSGRVAFKPSTETYPNDSFCNIPRGIYVNVRKGTEYFCSLLHMQNMLVCVTRALSYPACSFEEALVTVLVNSTGTNGQQTHFNLYIS